MSLVLLEKDIFKSMCTNAISFVQSLRYECLILLKHDK